MGETDEALQFMLDLNRAVAVREESKQTVLGPGLLALGGEFADAHEAFVSEDYIVG